MFYFSTGPLWQLPFVRVWPLLPPLLPSQMGQGKRKHSGMQEDGRAGQIRREKCCSLFFVLIGSSPGSQQLHKLLGCKCLVQSLYLLSWSLLLDLGFCGPRLDGAIVLNVNSCWCICLSFVGGHTVWHRGAKFDMRAALDLGKVKTIVTGANWPFGEGSQSYMRNSTTHFLFSNVRTFWNPYVQFPPPSTQTHDHIWSQHCPKGPFGCFGVEEASYGKKS